MFLPISPFGINASHRRRFIGRGSVAAFAAALLTGQTAPAQQEVWIGESNGLWSAGANWLDGTAPAVGGDTALALRFTNAVTATDDLAGPFALGRIIFDTNASTGVSIVGNAGSTLRFTGANPGIELRGIGDATLSLPLQLDATGGGLTISASGPGLLDLFGPISQGALAQPLTIDTGATSANASVVRLSGTQTFSGGVVLQSGNLAVASASALGTGALTVRGGAFSFANGGLVVANPIVLQADLTIQGAAGSALFGNLSGAISSATPGTGLILRTAGDSVRLSAASTYTGATTLDYSHAPQSATLAGGILSLTGTTGSLLQTSDFNIHAGSTLQLNGSAATDNRVADTTPVHLRGGGLLYLATTPGGTQQIETVGPVDGAGYSPITSSATTGISTRLNLQSLARTERGTFLFRGTGLGGTPGSGVGSIFVNTAPPGLVGGGGTGPAISILPYAVGDTSAAGTGIGFITYGATGLRPLNNTTEYRATLASAAANENVRLTAAQTLNAARTVNALLLDAGSVNGTGTLTIASGALFQRSGGGVSVPLDFGNVEANIFTTADLTLGGTIAGTNGLTKSGAGKLTLSAANSFTGPLTINAGTIAFSARVGLGGADSAIVINGHGAGLSYNGATAIAFSRPIETRTGLALLNAGGAGDFNITTPIAGAGGLQISAAGLLTIALPAGSTYAGTTHLGSGRLLIPGDSALGASGALNLAGGTLALAGNWSTAREINLVSATLDTAGFDAAWTGAVTGAGTLTKTGAGELRLAVPSRFRGTVAVQGGSFALADGGALAANVTVASGADFRIDHSAVIAANRLGDNATVTLTGGGFSLVGNAGMPVTERIGSLLFAAGGRTDQTLSLIAQGGAGVTLRLSSGLTLGNGDLVVRAPQLGDRERLVVGNAAALGSGVIPGVYADPALAGAGSSFVVYDSTTDAAGIIGIRPLRAAEYTTAAVLQNPATPVNASFFADAAVTAIGASNTIDNLTLASGASITLGAGQTLAITSGEVLARAGMSAISGGTLAFGNRRADFYTAGELTLGSSVTGTAGLKKSGPGTLIFAGSAGYSGGTLITGGVLRSAGGDPFSADTVTVNAPGAFDVGAGSFSIGALNGAGGVTLGGGTLTLGTSGTAFAFSGAFSGSGQIVIVDGGNPSALRTFSGSSSFAGNVILTSGRMRLGSADALGTATWIVNGGSLRTSTALMLAPALVLNADLPVLGTSALTLGSGASATGAKDLVLRSTAALNITGAFSLTGKLRTQFGPDDEFVLTPGTITVQGATGGITTAAGVRIESGGRLVLSDATAYTGGGEGRLGNATPVHLGGSTLQFIAGSAVNSTETFGALTSAGFSIVALTPTATTSAVLTTAALGRVERGTFSFGATTGTLGAALAPNVAQLLASAAPALIGGGGTGANTSIIPWAIGTSTASAAFVTYGPNGVRLLAAAEHVTSLTASTATSNVLSSAILTNTAPRTINALSFGGSSLSGTGTLTITSGAVLTPNTGTAISISTPLEFGAAEAQFFLTGFDPSVGTTISGAINGTGGLTRSGPLPLTLSGNNTFSGPITINGGALNFSTLANLGAGTDAITLHGHDASLAFTGANSVTIARPVHLGGGIGRLTASQSTGSVEFAGVIDGPGGLRVVGPGTVVLGGPNTYTGPTFIEGITVIASDASLGTGGGIFFPSGSSTLRLNGNWTTSRRIEVSNLATIDTNGNEALLNTPLIVASNVTLTKGGAGALRLIPVQNFSGRLTVRGGAVSLEQNATLGGQNYTLTTGGALVMDNGAVALNDRLADTATINFNGGEIRLVGNATNPVSERLGNVTVASGTSNTITVSAPGTAATTLTFGGIGPDFSGQEMGAVMYRGDQLGGAAGTPFTRIILQNAPATVGGIITGALASASSTGTNPSFAIYDASSDAAGVIGVRPLRADEYFGGAEIRNPVNGGTTSVTANFFANGPTTAGGGFNRINTLRLGGTANVTLDPAQVLAVDAGHLLVDAGAQAAIAGGTLAFTTTPVQLMTLGNLTLGSRLTGTMLAKSGAGALTLASGTVFGGTLKINAGTLNVAAGDGLRFATLQPASGTAIRFSQLPARVGTISGAGTIELPGAGTLTVQYLAGGFAITGPGGIKITSNATLTAPADFSGALTVTAENPYPSFNPRVTLSGDGTVLNASSITIGVGTGLNLDNTTKALARLGTVPVDLDGGTLIVSGTSGKPVAEILGNLTVRGLATLDLTTSATTANAEVLSFNGFTRADRGTMRFTSSFQFNPFGSVVKVLLPSSLASSLVGAGTTATNAAILPFATGFDGNMVAVTYSTTTGIRRLTASEVSASLTTGDNVRIPVNAGPTNNSTVTVNSLVAQADILGTGTITIASGLFGANGATQIQNGLSFGAAEAIFVIDQTSLTLLGALNGSGGLTKSGTGAIVLPAVNNISGPLTINAGALSFATPSQLGTDTGEIVMHSGGVLWSGAGDLVFPRAIRLNGGFGVLGTTGSTGTLHVAQPVTGPGGLNITGRAVFDTVPAYTGATQISGTLLLSSDALLGASPQVRFNGGTLALTGPWTTARELFVPNSGFFTSAIDTAGFDAAVNGSFTGSTWFTKKGAGKLTIQDATAFQSQLTISGGTVSFGIAGASFPDRLGSSMSIVLSNGTLELLGSPGISTTEQIGSLGPAASSTNRVRLTAPGQASHILRATTLSGSANSLTFLSADTLGGGPNGPFTRLVGSGNSSGFLTGWVVSDAAGVGLAMYDATTDASGPIGVRLARADEYVSGSALQNPANGGSTPTTANFRVSGSVGVVGATANVNTLTFAGGSTLTIPKATTLNVNERLILTSGGAPAIITGGSLAFGTNYNCTFLLGGDLIIAGSFEKPVFGTPVFLRKLGPATLDLRGNGNTGDTIIEEGAVRLGDGDPLAARNVTLAAGTTLDTASRSVSVLSLNGSGSVNLGSGGMLTLSAPSGFFGLTQGSGTLRVMTPDGASTFSVFTPAAPLTHAGPIDLDGGSLVLEGAGRVVGATTVRAEKYGTLSLRNSNGLPSSTALDFGPNGILDLQPGNASVNLGPLTGHGLAIIAPKHDTESLQVDFASLSRGPDGGAVFFLDADNTGLGAAPGPGVANLRFGPGFSANLIGGPGITPIIPFMSGAVPGGWTRLVTYDETNGARLLRDDEYSTTPIPGSNFLITDLFEQDGEITVNTLTTRNNIEGTGTVNVTGGLVILDDWIECGINFGTRQGNIILGRSGNVQGPIAGSGGLTITRGGNPYDGSEIYLASANPFTGSLIIIGVTVEFASVASLGADTGPITLYSSTLDYDGGGDFVLNRPLHLAAGMVEIRSPFNNVQLNGAISGSGGIYINVEDRTIITGANSYTGPTILRGDVTIGGPSPFGQSSKITMGLQSLTLVNSWTATQPILIPGVFTTLDTGAFDATLLGPLTATSIVGNLTKQGSGRLTIAGGADFGAVKLIVNGGTLKVQGSFNGDITAAAGTVVTGNAVVNPSIIPGNPGLSQAGVVSIAGALEPGEGVGEFSAGLLQMQANSTLRLLLESATAYDRVVSRDAPFLGSNVTLDLQLAPGFDPIDDFDTFILISNDSTFPISKATAAPLVFAGNALDEGEVFYASGQAWLFSYTGGSGNDVTIHAVPEPSIIATVAVGLAMLGFRRRRATR